MERVYSKELEYGIRQEFQRLKGQHYLDHAGATLYSETQMRNVCQDLCTNIYGNPHSASLHSKRCTEVIEEVRNRILKHFNTNGSKYSLIFTSGATAAIRLIIDNFDWVLENENGEEFFDTEMSVQALYKRKSAYIYTQSNHTSIVGGRESAMQKGVPFFCLGYEESFSLLGKEMRKQTKHISGNSLFAYPAQCNFSGLKYPMDWIAKVQNGALDSYGTGERRNSKWFVLLDAATYCSTNDLDLSVLSPDFVCLSFYKTFGYPTGLGALLVRNSSAYTLNKTYFGGGTVDVSLSSRNYRKFRKVLHERFEDGTVSFLSIAALNHGLKTLERLKLNMKIISQHVFNLANYAYRQLTTLRHWNGEKLVLLYADSDYTDMNKQGGILNFNLMRSDGRFIGYTEVLHIANLHNIHLRTGCFCNSGACQRHLRLTDRNLMEHFKAGHVCGDAKDIIDGKPTGSIRVSFGYMTTEEDIDVLIETLEKSFVEANPPPNVRSENLYLKNQGESAITLKKIWLYPIKSCGAMEVGHWRLNERGLEFDRVWMIVEETGICLTQKQEPRLSLILPMLDLERMTMTLIFRTANDPITISMKNEDPKNTVYDMCESKVCSDRILGYDCGDEVSQWLSRHLKIKGLRLIKQSEKDERKNKASKNLGNSNDGKLSLSNQAQYLLVNLNSVLWLQDRIESGDDINMETFIYRFRGNFLMEGVTPFSENNWSHITIGSNQFKVDGTCGRCQMICIDQFTGEKNRKPLVALSRALNGKIRFGIYLSHSNVTDSIIRVGDEISIGGFHFT